MTYTSSKYKVLSTEFSISFISTYFNDTAPNESLYNVYYQFCWGWPQQKPSVAQCDYKGSPEKLRENTQDFLRHAPYMQVSKGQQAENGDFGVPYSVEFMDVEV